ncbi:hypothetical protein SDC9_55622 [bioreactor metagenome]|uniref:Uncharacterized protein n=1 Tax=bioreactor metagenome TaxID=1076179 RepID=A0A644WZF7_9ZZZZ
MPVGGSLVFAREIQVDIRDFIASKSQEGLEGDVEAVFLIPLSADRAVCVGHIGAAAEPLPRFKVGVSAFGAAVVGRQGVHLGDARHVCHDGRSHRAAGAHQIAVVQGVLNQFLSGHVNDIVFTLQNVAQLGVDPVGYHLRKLFSVKLFSLTPYQFSEFRIRIGQFWCKEPVGKRFDVLAERGDLIRVLYHDFPRGLLAKIGEFLEHFACCSEVQRVRLVGVGKAFGIQQDMAVDLLFGVQKMDISGGADRFVQLLSELHHGPVPPSDFLFIVRDGFSVFIGTQHEAVVGNGLDFQEIVP